MQDSTSVAVFAGDGNLEVGIKNSAVESVYIQLDGAVLSTLDDVTFQGNPGMTFSDGAVTLMCSEDMDSFVYDATQVGSLDATGCAVGNPSP